MDSSSNSHEISKNIKEEELTKHFNELKTTISSGKKPLSIDEKNKELQKRLIRKDNRNEEPDETFLCEILNENQELQKKVRQLQNKEGEVRYENEKLKCKVKVICGERRKNDRTMG